MRPHDPDKSQQEVIQREGPFQIQSTSAMYRLSNFAGLVTSFVVTLSAVLYIRSSSYRDPTSFFFDPDRAFEFSYSTFRAVQAEDYIQSASSSWHADNPSLCIGIPSVQRQGVRYLRPAVGSLLQGLTEEQRNDIYLVILVAHTDPSQHEAWGDEWLHTLPDKIMSSNQTSTDKGRLDYTHLLQACYETKTRHILMLEDDVLAMEGWYDRARQALDDLPSSLYLRFFYTEVFLGWNKESWQTYLAWSILAEVLAGLTLYMTGRSKYTSATILVFFMPVWIGLYFAAGRMSVRPIRPGIHLMNDSGCCSQALAFPRQAAPDLIQYLRKSPCPVDSAIEAFADERGLDRWALTPSIFQHVGVQSSKEVRTRRWGRPSTATLWNFAFELNGPPGNET